MLDRAKVDAILKDLGKYKGTTVGDLIAFMHSLNLRFGRAETNAQRDLYTRLNSVLADKLAKSAPEVAAEKTEKVGATEETPEPPAPDQSVAKLGDAAKMMFGEMSEKDLGLSKDKSNP